MRESDRSRAATLLLMEGNRLRIAGAVVVVVFGLLVAVVLAAGVSVLGPGSPMYFLFGSLVTGDLTLLTVVLSINQLVLSRELGDPGSLRRRIEDTLDYRRDVERLAGASASPNSPLGFLRFLHGTLAARTEDVEELAGGLDEAALRGRIESLVDSIERDVRLVERALAEDGADIFSVLAATLATNHADQLHAIAEVRAEHAAAVADDLDTRLDDVAASLLQIDVARRYVRTIYVEKELAYLSRVLLYVGVPAIVGSGLVLVLYNASPATAVPPALRAGVVALAFTVGFAPLAILLSFVLRLAWVAQQTAAVAPFSSEPPYRP